MAKRYYLKCLTPQDVAELVRQTLGFEEGKMKNIKQTCIAYNMCAIMFDVKEGRKNSTYVVKLTDFECEIVSRNFRDRKVIRKKYAELLVPMIAEKNKQGKILLSSVDYKNDYNLYHTVRDNKCRSENIDPEDKLEDIVLK